MWKIKGFHQLTVDDLYQILSLRSRVFVMEQRCIYQDLDNRDQEATHCMLYSNHYPQTLVAYCRLFGPTEDKPYSSFGRVVVAPEHRREKFGKMLVEKAIQLLHENYPDYSINISAQHYLLDFYAGFGLEAVGDIYQEDDIPHIKMIMAPAHIHSPCPDF